MNGVLPVDKPAGPTSHDVVAAARRALGVRRIGHTGTLDPFASGLLLLCVGPATRLAEYLTALSKEYLATVRFGEATDTDDHTGRVIRQNESWQQLSTEQIGDAFAALVGRIEQLPPAFSAKKVNGRRMYEAARAGELCPRTAALVHVEQIEILEAQLPDVHIRVRCGAGTYIRALARDAGDALGVGGHLVSLRRTAIGEHSVRNALALAELADSEAAGAALISPLDAVPHLPRVQVGAEQQERLINGNVLPAEHGGVDGTVAVCSAEGTLLAIGRREGGMIQPRKVFR